MEKPPILAPGEPVTITYSDGNVEPNWQVMFYDDGLVRIERGRQKKVINLRAPGVLSVTVD